MMCCSKAEHTRKQNFPYLLIEDYSGASSDNLEEQEEIICDYRRKKNQHMYRLQSSCHCALIPRPS